jgi:hypothetical protein
MENKAPIQEQFDESKSLHIMNEMIAVSTKNLKNDGLLLLAWGWVGCCINVMGFLPDLLLLSKRLIAAFHILIPVLMVGVILFTTYYMYQKRKQVKTYVATATRYTWFSFIVVYNLMVMIIKTKTGTVNFELLHPLQMTLIGMSLFITGGLYRSWMLCVSGVLFWVTALSVASLELEYQRLWETVVVFIAVVVPGHILYHQSLKKNV